MVQKINLFMPIGEEFLISATENRSLAARPENIKVLEKI